MLRNLLPAAGLVSALAVTAALAQTGPTVTVKSSGGSAVTGELVEIDGAFYKLRTSLGVIEIDMTDATCVGEGCPKTVTLEEFSIAGSPSIGAELMPALVLGYADSLQAQIAYESGDAAGDQVLRVVDGGGDDLAVIALEKGSDSPAADLTGTSAAIGMATREIGEDEVAALLAAGIPDLRGTAHERQIALDAVAVLVHPENPVRAVSLADLAGIFAGEITSWAALGGPDRPIALYAQDDKSEALDIFDEQVLRPAGKALAASVARPESSHDLADTLAVDPGAIAIAGQAYAGGSTALGIRHSCGLVTRPSDFTVKAGEYPLTRRLYLYEHPVRVAKHARSLLDFAVSDAAQPVIAAARLVDRSLAYSDLTQMGGQFAHTLASGIEVPTDAFRAMVAELEGAKRLSATLRFVPGSTDLDTLSRQNLAALARQIGRGAFDGHEMLLIGFSDAAGAFDEHLALSQSRAESALQALTQAAGPKAVAALGLQAKSFGGLMPVACNDDAAGRELNRRVEIWLRPARS